MSIRFAALTAYIALAATFMTAAMLSQPDAAAVSLSSVSLEKTSRLISASPSGFVMERFAS